MEQSIEVGKQGRRMQQANQLLTSLLASGTGCRHTWVELLVSLCRRHFDRQQCTPKSAAPRAAAPAMVRTPCSSPHCREPGRLQIASKSCAALYDARAVQLAPLQGARQRVWG